MENKKIAIALFGCGRIGQIHLKNLLNFDHIILKYLYDPWIKEDIKKYIISKGIEYVTDQKTIFDDPEIKIIVICTPTNTHMKLIEAAILAKKHVFCEKPIADNIKDAFYLTQISTKNPEIKIQIGFNRRWDHNFRTIKEKVQAGLVGDLHLVNIISYDPGLPPYEYLKVSGGIFFDMSIHDFDMVRYLTNDEISEIYTRGAVLIDKKLENIPDIDSAVIHLKLKNKKTLCTITNSRQAIYGYDQRVEILGSKGGITTENDRPSMVIWKTKDAICHEKPLYFFLERYQQSYCTELETFICNVIENKKVAPNVHDGYQALLIAEAAKKSWKENRVVKLTEISK